MPDVDDDYEHEIEYERDCPYFARYYRFEGHDANATCSFGCVDEPVCVTGSWLTDEQFDDLKADFENKKRFEYNLDLGAYTHLPNLCVGEPCTLHNPSDHHMADWPMVLRGSGLIERTCPHGVGHPDPDSAKFFADRTGETHWGVHGCDGCCR